MLDDEEMCTADHGYTGFKTETLVYRAVQAEQERRLSGQSGRTFRTLMSNTALLKMITGVNYTEEIADGRMRAIAMP